MHHGFFYSFTNNKGEMDTWRRGREQRNTDFPYGAMWVINKKERVFFIQKLFLSPSPKHKRSSTTQLLSLTFTVWTLNPHQEQEVEATWDQDGSKGWTLQTLIWVFHLAVCPKAAGNNVCVLTDQRRRGGCVFVCKRRDYAKASSWNRAQCDPHLQPDG